jgi:hypothetical protein
MDMHDRHSTEGSTPVSLSGSNDEQLRFAITRKRLIQLEYGVRA